MPPTSHSPTPAVSSPRCEDRWPDMVSRTLRRSIITSVFSLFTIYLAADPIRIERASQLSPSLLEGIRAQYRTATGQPAATDQFTIPGSAGCSVTPLACDTDRSGTLGPGDCISDDDMTYRDIWTFRGTFGQTVTITMRSASFDSYLYLGDPSGNLVASNDNSAGEFDSIIEFTLTETGEWGIIANQVFPASGPYVLLLQCSAGVECTPQIDDTSCGAIVASTIDITDCTRDGLPIEFWNFTGGAGQNVAVTANRLSGSGNVGLVLMHEDGTPLADDAADSATASLSATLSKGGTWVIAVLGTTALDYSMSVECPAESSCFPSADSLCLNNNRFRVTVAASDPRTGKQGVGRSIPYNDINGFFAFPDLTDDPSNLEVFVKVLDGRTTNGHFWVFFGGLTDFAYTITVTESTTGLTRTYDKAGLAFIGGADTSAF